MAGILIIAHAPLASSLKAVALHAFADTSVTVEALDVPPDMPLDEIEAQAALMLGRVANPEALVLSDVFGATPCNVAQRLADGERVRVVTGVNVPMLWRAISYANEPMETLVARAMAGAVQGVMQVASVRPKNQTPKPGGNDQEHHHHQ